MDELQRIVLFADVHGNITGLRAVLDEAARLENVTISSVLATTLGMVRAAMTSLNYVRKETSIWCAAAMRRY